MGIEELKNLKTKDVDNGETEKTETRQSDKPKRGRGWPKGKKRPTQRGEDHYKNKGTSTGEHLPVPSSPNPLFTSFINRLFDGWSLALKEDSIKLKKNEAESFALSLEQIMALYLPQLDPKMAMTLQCLTTMGMIIYPRAGVTLKKIKEKRAERGRDEKNTDSG